MDIVWATLKTENDEMEYTLQKNASIPCLSESAVLIEIKCCGVSIISAQVMQELFKKRPQIHYATGYEVAGVVSDVGSNVTSLSPGDHVTGILPLDSPSSGFAQFCMCSEFDLVRMSDSLSFEMAAAGIGDGVKCYTALHYLGHLQRGESVLVTDPLSSWGSLLLQLCKQLGTKTVALISQAADKSVVTGLGADVVIEGFVDSLVNTVMEETGGLGVDLVIDNGVHQFTSEEDRKLIASENEPGVPHKHDLISCLAVGGRWVTSQHNLQLDPPDSQQLFLKCATVAYLFEPTWTLCCSNIGKYQHILKDVEKKLASGALEPNIVQKLTMDNIIEHLQGATPRSRGKSILKL